MLAAGTITAPALLEVYLDRIARLDAQLRSYRVVLADAARQEAEAAQRRPAAARCRPPQSATRKWSADCVPRAQ